MGETFGIPSHNSLRRTGPGRLQFVVVEQSVQHGIEEFVAKRVPKTEIDHHHVAGAPGVLIIPVSETVLTLPPDFHQVRGRHIGHSQLVKRIFVRGEAKWLPAFTGLAPLLQDRTRIAAPHLGGRILDHDSAGAFKILLHAPQQMRLSIAGIPGHDDAPARPHLLAEKPFDIAFDMQSLEIFFGQRFRDRFPACRGKRAPQPSAVLCATGSCPAASPLTHPIDSPATRSPASPRGTKTSRGKAAMLD